MLTELKNHLESLNQNIPIEKHNSFIQGRLYGGITSAQILLRHVDALIIMFQSQGKKTSLTIEELVDQSTIILRSISGSLSQFCDTRPRLMDDLHNAASVFFSSEGPEKMSQVFQQILTDPRLNNAQHLSMGLQNLLNQMLATEHTLREIALPSSHPTTSKATT